MQRRHYAAVELAVLILAAQQTATADQIVSLRNTSSNLFVDVVGAQTNDGQPAILFNFNGNRNQLFEMRLERDVSVSSQGTPIGDVLVAQHSLKCLGVAGASRDDFAPIIQSTCHPNHALTSEGAAQLWLVEAIGRPCPPPGCFPIGFRIRNVNSGKCIDARNPNFPTPPPGSAPLQQFTCARDTNDLWWVNQTFDFNSPGPAPVVH